MKKRDAWIISILILISTLAIIYINYFDLNLAPKQGSSVPQRFPSCITPPAYPQLITQSGTICSGNYAYGIGIGANNIKLTCQPNTQFNGATWTGLNGLTISGRRNITVEGCNFNGFGGNGVYVGNVTPLTEEINLVRITSRNNINNGVYVGHNTINITINEGDISYNNKDGIIFTSNYVGVAASAKLSPKDILISKNRIARNGHNGVNFDEFDYYLNYSMQDIPLNNSVTVIENNIFENQENGIQNIGFDDDIFHNEFGSDILLNRINNNGKSGIAIISSYSDRAISEMTRNPNSYDGAGFRYIAYNDITNNALDGISFYTSPKIVNYFYFGHRVSLGFELYGEDIFANFISGNRRNGISSAGESYSNNERVSSDFGARIVQNSIRDNLEEGIYLRTINNSNSNLSSYSWSEMSCNDIIFNGNANKDGIKINNIGDKAFYWFDINLMNIIESNLAGISLEDHWSNQSSNNQALIRQNYMGLNSIGLSINMTNISEIVGNDFNSNILHQAFDTNLSSFSRNWWSDYSPTCLDRMPADGWCDFSRPIPVNNQDIQPKAGNSWGNNARGYLQRDSPGIFPKESCGILIRRPIPRVNNSIIIE